MKRILVSQRVHILEEIAERRDELSQEWAALSVACGFLQLAAPNDISAARALMEGVKIDGILLTGGNDLAAYGGDAPERDRTERYLIKEALERGLPLLGVCRGMQMLLDYFGSSLQRLEGHVRTKHRLDNAEVVNSFHSFGAYECRPPLEIIRRSEDGAAEEVVHRERPLRGMMWHPERCVPFRREDMDRIKEVFRL